MSGLYARWMDQWERKLAMRDTNRVVRPFEWGTDWLNGIGFPDCPGEVNGNAAACVDRFVTEAVAASERFYSYDPPRDYSLQDGRLTFTARFTPAIPKTIPSMAAGSRRKRRAAGRWSYYRNGTRTRKATSGLPSC